MKKPLFIIIPFFVFYLLLPIATAFADQEPYNLIVPIPVPELEKPITNPAQYIAGIYKFSLGFGAILAIGIITYGGILYTVSAGNTSKQSEAKDIITNAVWGLVLLSSAVLILNTINPELVKLRLPALQPITVPPPPSEFQEFQKASADAGKALADFKTAEKNAESLQVGVNAPLDKRIKYYEARLKTAQARENLLKADAEQQRQLVNDLRRQAGMSIIGPDEPLILNGKINPRFEPQQEYGLTDDELHKLRAYLDKHPDLTAGGQHPFERRMIDYRVMLENFISAENNVLRTEDRLKQLQAKTEKPKP